MTSVKCVVVGDGAVGKTCLLMRQSSDSFSSDYVPTIFDSGSTDITVDEQEFQLQLFDTAGQDDYDRLRPVSYRDTNVFIVCFSIVDPDSLENIREKWVPEIKHHCPNVPFILVGTKSDLRNESDTLEALKRRGRKPVSKERGVELAQQLEAVAYAECSAKEAIEVRAVFELAIRTALNPPPPRENVVRRRRCNIL